MRILALESSCDDSGAAIVEDGRNVLASVVSSQVDLHAAFGGVVPEVAARQHIKTMNVCVDEALQKAGLTLDEIDAFGATLGPGLVGSLLIGANTAKTLSMLTGKPFLGVNHLYAHVCSNYLDSDLEPPFLCLLVSGGHTQLIRITAVDQMEILGETLDDAVGESYDKIARMMDLGFPGGPALDKLAATSGANPNAYALPTATTKNPLDFSFSGLKTATMRAYEKAVAEEGRPVDDIKIDIAASFQKTVVNTLFKKVRAAGRLTGITTWTVAGGVSANRGLRQRFTEFAEENPDHRIFIPKMAYCMDNAAMVASSAFFNPISTNIAQEVMSRM